jgi:hypothetical protein
MQEIHASHSRQDFEPLMNSKAAAALLGGIHPKTLKKLAGAGEIPGYLIFGEWQFRKSGLDNWLESKLHSRIQSHRVNEEEVS